MEKILLTNKADLEKAISTFGQSYRKEIAQLITHYPCILVGYYSEDVDFGSGYTFTTIYHDDFNGKGGSLFRQKKDVIK